MRFGAFFTLAPLLMNGSLLLAAVTATAHHIFYSKVNNSIVQSPNEQEWFSRIGTGLAFIVKSLLAASASLAYTQLLWYTVKNKSFTLSGLNSLFAVTHDVWQFSNLEAWRHGLPLLSVALFIWAAPLIAVFTPGTLTVQKAPSPNDTVQYSPIPSIDYDAVNHFAQWDGSSYVAQYAGPSNRLARLMAAVTSQGSILHLAAPAANSSFSLQFFGPSISCGASTLITESDVVNMISELGGHSSGHTVEYVGFTPQFALFPEDNPDIKAATLQGLNYTLANYLGKGQTYDHVSNDHARLFVALPGRATASSDVAAPIECGLYNTSYQVQFTFTDGQQDIQVVNATRLNGVSAQRIEPNDCDVPTGPAGPCFATKTAYISILDALGSYIVGQLDQSLNGGISVLFTQVMNSVFMQTQELHRISSSQAIGGFMDEEPLFIANMSMSVALEQVFTNVTLSLFSDSYFLENQSTASVGPVHILTPQNAYFYRPRNLLIAYCSSIAATTLVVVVGLFCIAATDPMMFDTSFSTILRTTRNQELDALVMSFESTGAKPLSKALARTRLRLLDHGCGTGDSNNGDAVCGAGSQLRFTVIGGSGSLGQGSDALGEPDVEQAGINMTHLDTTTADSLLLLGEDSS